VGLQDALRRLPFGPPEWAIPSNLCSPMEHLINWLARHAGLSVEEGDPVWMMLVGSRRLACQLHRRRIQDLT
jgi:hypothetical protein